MKLYSKEEAGHMLCRYHNLDGAEKLSGQDGVKTMAIPHKDCRPIAPADFSSDCTNPTQEYCRISRRICAR